MDDLEVEDDNMFGRDGSGLRGRNVEDISELEEKGLLRRRSEDRDDSTPPQSMRSGVSSPRRRVITQASFRGEKGGQTGFERIVLDDKDEQGESGQGLSSKRDKQAFALLVLLCELNYILSTRSA